MSAVILAGVVVSGAWTHLDEIGWAGWLALALVAVCDRYAPPLRWRRPSPRSHAIERAPLVAAAAICALFLGHLALTWRDEFGFGGDEGYHLSATRTFALYFMRAGPLLAAVMVVYGVLRLKRIRYAATIALGGLVAASYALPPSALFGRYPTGFYLLSTPLNVLFEALHSPYPYTANHVMNVLSVPSWLFVLRPLIIGRWPDWRVLPVALLMYFQPPALVYVASALLEPWAFVFVLLAAEALVALEPDDRWIAVPLCVMASCFKETAILLLPTVWLLAFVTWRNGRPSIRPGGLQLGATAVAPFIVYYAVRRGVQIERGYEVAGAASTWTSARVQEWVTNVRAQLGLGGMIAVGAATVLAARYGAIWIATAIALAVFFFVDAGSLPYTGYGRFLAYSLMAVCAAVFAGAYRLADDRRAMLVICAALFLLQAVPVTRMLALDLQPNHERNSLEWTGSLIRMPIRALSSRLPQIEGGAQVKRVRVIAFASDLISLKVAYPDLAARYELIGDLQPAATPDCRCRDNTEAVLAVFEWPAHFGDTPEARAIYTQTSAVCVKHIEMSCVTRAVNTDRSGATVGAMGVGRVMLIASPQDHERPQR